MSATAPYQMECLLHFTENLQRYHFIIISMLLLLLQKLNYFQAKALQRLTRGQWEPALSLPHTQCLAEPITYTDQMIISRVKLHILASRVKSLAS